MTKKRRLLLAFAMALVLPALGIVASLPDPPAITEWKLDVSSSASLEADCARTPPPNAALSTEFPFDGGMGRWYRASRWGHATTPLLSYGVLVAFDFGAYNEPPHPLYEGMVKGWECAFPANHRGSLRVDVDGLRTKEQVIEVIRAVGASTGAAIEEIHAAIAEFEAGGTGLNVDASDDMRRSIEVRDHALRLERAGLTVWFSVEDRSDPPARAARDERRYSLSIGFVPAN